MEGISPTSPRRVPSAACIVLIAPLALGLGCRRRHAPLQAAPARASRGFDRSLSAPPQPLSGAMQEKLHRANAAAPQPHFTARRVAPAHAVDLYVDGSLRRTLQTAELTRPETLEHLLSSVAVRAVLAHGRSGELWIAGSELGNYELKVNRRGAVKLQDRSVGGAHRGGRLGAAGGSPGTTPLPAHVRREREVSGVEWLEVRTPPSARLPDEP